MGVVKTVMVLLVVIVLFCFTVQFQLLPKPSGSAIKVINKKASSPVSDETVAPMEMPRSTRTVNLLNKSEETLNGSSRGNSTALKQVDKDIKSRVDSQGVLNHSTLAHLEPLPLLSGPPSLELLQDVLLKANRAQTIRNSDRFPPLGEVAGLVVIVQVHKRVGYLKQLLESLKVAKGIENVLLVISHDYYYDDMNELIRTVDFCPVSD